jgi:hypothetical protein
VRQAARQQEVVKLDIARTGKALGINLGPLSLTGQLGG